VSHHNHVLDGKNQDLSNGRDREYYLDLAYGFMSSFGPPVVQEMDGYHVVREELIDVGSKARFGELLFSKIKETEVVYVQPRYGFAGVSLSMLAKMYRKNLTLFMPASKVISEHQAYAIEQGAVPMFHRVAAMPNLNRIAKKYADEQGAFFIPFGLRHELVTAMIVKTCDDLITAYSQPKELWCAISTGVLCRGLQIGFPDSEIHAVAVARNLKAGEAGRAKIRSHHLDFHRAVEKTVKIPFDSASNYDAKAWQYMLQWGSKGSWFWNVAGNLTSGLDKTKVRSERGWK